MISLLQETAVPAPRVAGIHRVRVTPAGARLWRVIALPDGRVIGHLRAVGEKTNLKWSAQRFSVASRAFRDLGEFWSADDAVQALHAR